ncbi:MAG: AAA family ATPase, partial [Bacteroidetes bacterium RIFOXYB2_FULL_35_7]
RCQVYILKHLEEAELIELIHFATENDSYLETKKISVKETDALIRFSGGDARKLYNILDIVIQSETSDNIEITNKSVIDRLQENIAIYDKNGEQHYDIISAFIKSIRGSDPNAAVYWLARMIAGGEDPKFIARRMLILASEDIGLANPNALLLANSCFQAINVIGMPEGRIILSETAIYLATSPKSNSSYMAINEAMDLVQKTGNLPVPLHIRNAPTKLMKDVGYGKDYKYAHSYENNFVEQEFLPEQIKNTVLYDPQNNPREKDIEKWLMGLWKEKYKN